MNLPRDVSADLFRAIAEYTYDWETWVDAEGRARWVNAAVERITGYSVEECLGRADYPLFLAISEDRPLFARVLADAAAGGSGNDVEFRIAHKRAGPRWVAVSWQAIRAADARALGFRTSVRDIHQRKQMEAELHEIRRRAEALAQARSELLANVSHELRSPAHHIAGFAELLAQEPLSERQRRHVELIAGQARSMLRQVEDLLSLAALEAGGVELACEPFDLAALCRDLRDASAPEADARGLALEAEVALDPPWVEGDAQRVGQVLRNLIDNALKFSERGAVRLSARRALDAPRTPVVFEVIDSGRGMDPAQVERLLLPFHQGDSSSRRQQGGVGLGLAIVERLVRAMDGELAIESALGRGTRVRVSLPLAEASAPARASTSFRSPAPARASTSLRSPAPARASTSALVVDDSAAARELLCELLRGIGFQASEAASAEEAKALVTARPFDVIFLDYQMPGSDGAEVALALRQLLGARPSAPRTRIYILTANVFVHEQLRAARNALDGILTKPLSRAALIDALQLRSPDAAPSTPAGELDEVVLADLQATRARDGQTLFQKLLPRVQRDMQDALAAAHAALAQHAWDELRRAAHAAAGHAALIGARDASARACALERELERPKGGEAAPKLLADCESAWARAAALLSALEDTSRKR